MTGQTLQDMEFPTSGKNATVDYDKRFLGTPAFQ